jgi:hypothetical protein
MLDQGFAFLESKLSEDFTQKEAGSLPLASIIPIVSRMFGKSNFPGIAEAINHDPMLLAFCMIIYAPAN